MSGRAMIAIEGIAKRFGATVAVDAVDLMIAEGEFFALLGPSGCGKTTLLRMLAGLEVPSAGRILIDGVDVTAAPPNRRPVNMVFQSYAVFPHMSVADNVGYGLRMEGVAKRERAARVAEALDLVRLGGFEGRKPDQLSGGQRQRVALARALVKRPRVLLLDEPLSALDAKLREAMRGELSRIQRRLGMTFVMVTHDQEEALATAGRCAVMNAGRIEQVASPFDLYEHPASRFVADFIGSVNLVDGVIGGLAGDVATVHGPGLPCEIGAVRAAGFGLGDAVTAALRPERIAMSAGEAAIPPVNAAHGRVLLRAYLGSETLYEVAIGDGRRLKVRRPNLARGGSPAFEPGQPVTLTWMAEDVTLLS